MAGALGLGSAGGAGCGVIEDGEDVALDGAPDADGGEPHDVMVGTCRAAPGPARALPGLAPLLGLPSRSTAAARELPCPP